MQVKLKTLIWEHIRSRDNNIWFDKITV